MISSFMDKTPVFGERCFVADNAAVVGEVTMGDDCSVWHGASVRADFDAITIEEIRTIKAVDITPPPEVKKEVKRTIGFAG
jgi:carbonic anhydrase/acetyltransferase-like protein (isoleucine patch superfamily)